ncbi:MAG: peptidoglycan bridge formation glycyltransferase FemA/FemB family protein, partial [Treponema sp.]|nr:peptidoglycan bridge formation glycyltransferase FemA/FemB family protein [Treponema sp.]
DIFYSLLKETAKRDHISIHNINYYKTLFSHTREYQKKDTESGSAAAPVLHLYTAEYEGEALASIIVLFRGREAVYLYGASSGSKRNLMSPYALQVRAMMDAKDLGCSEYDLFGIPPSEDPHHPMAGLYRFKTGFGGRIIHRPGSWDYTYRPLAMELFRFMESLRKKIRDFRKRGRVVFEEEK